MVRASRDGVMSELKLRPPENREATCKTSARMGGAVARKRDSSGRKQRGPQNHAKTGHLDAGSHGGARHKHRRDCLCH